MTAALLALALLAVLLLARGGKKSNPAPVPLPSPTDWRFLYCHGMPDAPTPNGEGCRFDFPQAPGSANYVVRRNVLPIDRIAVRFTVTGGGFVPQEAPSEQALVSLVAYVGEARYYSRNAVKLEAGTHTLAASAWITVDGKPASPLTPDRIGLVFGWEAGRGHGVSGNGSFTLESLR